jgi:cytochrome c-type biogenesis protein CcmH/NrfG
MNDDVTQQILAELRKLRRSNQAAMIVTVLMLVGAAIYFPLRLRSVPFSPQTQQSQADSWDAVRSAMDHFEYDKASGIAQRLVARYPNDYYGYSYLGNIALATGCIKEAESYYARAYELLPSEQHEKMLQAIQKRLERQDSTQPTAAPIKGAGE